MPEELETDLDKLYSYVCSRGKVSLAKAARELNAKQKHLEKIAELLEQSGMVEIAFGLFGTELVAVKPECKEKKLETPKKMKEMQAKKEKVKGITNPVEAKEKIGKIKQPKTKIEKKEILQPKKEKEEFEATRHRKYLDVMETKGKGNAKAKKEGKRG